jgi:hypothetical protein
VIPYDFNHLEQGARKLFDEGRPDEAKYWYGRAIEENPVANAHCVDEILKLGEITIDHLL